MKCKSCRVETKVVDSRKKSDGVWRRRECPACKTRFSTLEVVNTDRPDVSQPKVRKPSVRKRVVVPKTKKVVRKLRDKSARRTMEDYRDQIKVDEFGW